MNTLDCRFLSKLAVDIRLHGQGFGRRALQAAQHFLRDEKVQELLIEVSHEEGFLVQYYKELGFVVTDRTDIDLESGTHNMILMKCDLGR